MYKRQNRKIILIALFACLLTLSIGLASLSSSLYISANVTAQGSNFDIKITSFVKSDGSAFAEGGNISINGTTVTITNFELPERRTFLEYTAVIKNQGNIPAYLSSFSLNTPPVCTGNTETENTNVCNYLYLTATDTSGNEFPHKTNNVIDETLDPNQSKTIKIRINYDMNNQASSSEYVYSPTNVSNLKVIFTYSQKRN